MKCPDCGGRLAEVMFGPNESAYRCFRCGGFWIDSGTANSLSAQALSSWRRISVDPVWLRGGKGTCPADGIILTRYSGENLPPNVTASRCIRCGKWWFPGENLFAFKPALEAKVSYFRMWGYTGNIAKIGLPVVVAAVLVGGIVAGVNLAVTRTQNAVPAADIISRVAVMYVGSGVGVATFGDAGTPVTSVKYRLSQTRQVSRADENAMWEEATVGCDQELCQARLTDLIYGQEYELQIAGRSFRFVAQ